MGWPRVRDATGGEVENVALSGSPKPVQFTRDATGLHVTLPVGSLSDFASVLKLLGSKTASRP